MDAANALQYYIIWTEVRRSRAHAIWLSWKI